MAPDGSADDLAPVRPLDAARRRRGSTPRWLGVAAAALLVLGIGGYWLADTNSSSVGTADQVAGSAETTLSAPAAPESGVAQDAAAAASSRRRWGPTWARSPPTPSLRDALRAGTPAESVGGRTPDLPPTTLPTSPVGPATRPPASTGPALEADAAAAVVPRAAGPARDDGHPVHGDGGRGPRAGVGDRVR